MQLDSLRLDDRTAEPSVPVLHEHRVLHEAVAERLRELIVEGGLAPGAHLNERVLCERLGVSRTPLREAFRTLAGEGIVELQPNRGAVVATLSRADVEHAFELMAALEALAGGLAAARASVAERDELRALHFEMLAAHARRDLPTYYRLNSSIHRRLVACARNPVLAETYARLNARLQSLRFRSNLNRDKWDAAVAEHAAMIEALDAGDGERLAAVLRAHLDHKRATVLAQLDAGALALPAVRDADGARAEDSR
ncbi:MAG: GntR family transcriptional regulator [Burkholderiales bacterium]|nr:MAG: GntR family transcriptional regulator [Burkholderiales bacterium]